ncbi:MAG: response regulator transcription factor [Dehalococcoidales bacterium]|nr:response regulator transcription factor [Dehalococcoidales bacterium]
MTDQINLLALDNEEINSYLYEALTRKSTIRLLGVLSDASAVESITDYRPDVLLVGTRRLDTEIIRKLARSRPDISKMGLIILFNSYSQDDIQTLKHLAPEWHGGIAVFLRQSLSHTDQLINIIKAVSQGQITLDPSLAQLMFAVKKTKRLLNQLTSRELEVLNLLASGQTNMAIADSLFIDVKTVEHHLNSIYSKIKAEISCDNKHPRVSAARLYLEEAGQLAVAS